MLIGEFIYDVLNMDNIREQFLTEVCFTTKYYKVVLRRLHITDMRLQDDYLIIKLNDGRTQKLYVTDDLQYETRKIDF